MQKIATLTYPVPANSAAFSYLNGHLRFVDAMGVQREVDMVEAVTDSTGDSFHYWDQLGNKYTITTTGQVTVIHAPGSTKR
jgi:hypothetical protein